MFDLEHLLLIHSKQEVTSLSMNYMLLVITVQQTFVCCMYYYIQVANEIILYWCTLLSSLSSQGETY